MTDSSDASFDSAAPDRERRWSLRPGEGGANTAAVHVVYGLYTISLVTALPSLLGVIIAYLKRREVRGSWLESHVIWQIRTFWIMLAASLVTTGVGFASILYQIALAIFWVEDPFTAIAFHMDMEYPSGPFGPFGGMFAGTFLIFTLLGLALSGIVWLWFTYRALKGWLLLIDQKEIRAPRAFL